MENLRSLLKKRVTCRNFTDQALSREKVAALIQDAVRVPSGSNNQPWHFVVITDKDRMKDYSDAAKKGWLENFAACPYIHQYEDWIRDPEYNIFYNAPALVIIYGNRQAHWHVYDCSMVACNLHLLAEEDSLGCCWIGFAHNIFDDQAIKKELGVEEEYELVAPIILGHPATRSELAENPNKRKPFTIDFK